MTNYQFKKILAEGMGKLGYENTIPRGGDIHFVKRLKNGFYISVFLYYHRFEKGAYTADFHLAYYASSGYTGGEQYLLERVGNFLKISERKKLLNDQLECVDEVAADAWWYRTDEDSVFNFIKAVEITEERYIVSKNLFNMVLKNDHILMLYFRLLEIGKLATESLNITEELIFQPKKEKYGIDPIWYQACEIYQRERKKKNRRFEVSRSTVSYQTVSAYKTYIFEQRYGKPPFFDELLARYNKLLEDEKFK